MTREEAIKIVKEFINGTRLHLVDHEALKEALETLIPELKESEDEKIRKVFLSFIDNYLFWESEGLSKEKALAWLERQKELDKMIVVSPEVWDNAISDAFENGKKEGEKQKDTTRENVIKELEKEFYACGTTPKWFHKTVQEAINFGKAEAFREIQKIYDKVREKEITDVDYGIAIEEWKEQKPEMILWTGKNLKEVIDFTGKYPRFDEWFKSWEEYENYVHSHNNIFKLFCEDGSHYEVPVGSWIIKTPDGFNIPSHFKFVQNPAEIDEYKIIKKHITEDALSSEVTKRLKECGWYVTYEKPAEWSLTDATFIEEIDETLFMAETGRNEVVKNQIERERNWIKSLPERFSLQPKQEWSEEDAKKLNRIVEILVEGSRVQNWWKTQRLLETEEMETLTDFLKSLRPQPHTVPVETATKLGNIEYERGVKDGIQSEKSHQWKPGEEQMKWLKDVIETVPMTCRQQAPLESLYNDLLKLM